MALPLDLTPALWYDASQQTGFADGGAMNLADDFSGNAHQLTQGTGADQPIFRAKSLNGKPGFEFAGVADSLFKNTVAILKNVTGGTLIVLARATSSPTTLKGVMSIATGDATFNGRMGLAEGSVSGQHRYTTRRLDADANDGRNGGTVSTTVAQIRTGRADYSAGTRDLRIDGTSVVSASGLATGSTSNTDSGRIVLGNLANLSAGTVAIIYEALAFNSYLSDTDAGRIEGYLRGKWWPLRLPHRAPVAVRPAWQLTGRFS